MTIIQPPITVDQLEAATNWILEEQNRIKMEREKLDWAELKANNLNEITEHVKKLMSAYIEISETNDLDYLRSMNNEEYEPNNNSSAA